jgi:MinD superfamily P-loop ATPase
LSHKLLIAESFISARLKRGERLLVAMVREMAREQAASRNIYIVLIDGSPGIGCPVIASLTGADPALVVIEPTIRAVHDLERILGVAGHFQIKAAVCINKYDLNSNFARRIKVSAAREALRWSESCLLIRPCWRSWFSGEPVIH